MMYPGPFKAVPMGFHYPGHQAAPPFYQSLYAGYNAHIQAPHENPALSYPRPFPLSGDPYALAAGRQPAQHSLPAAPQYAPPIPSHHHNNHGSKGKKHTKRRSVSPYGSGDQSLDSDDDKSSENGSGNQLLAIKTTTKRDLNNNDHQQKSHGHRNSNDENCQGSDEQKNSVKIGKRKSRSKKKRERPLHNGQKPVHYQGDLPEQIKAQVQAIQNSYSQAYGEHTRRDEVHHKQAKRTTRLSHEENHTAAAGRPDISQSNTNPPHPTCQVHGLQTDYFNTVTPYNAYPPRTNATGTKNPLEREIQRLRHHIRTLESELNKLNKKVNKSSANNNEMPTKEGHHSKAQRSKRISPRHTPVIVEMINSTSGTVRELGRKKHQHRSRNHQDKKQNQQSEKICEEITKKTRTPSPKEPEINPYECLHTSGNHTVDAELKPSKSSSSKQLCSDTAAQLACAAEARINARPPIPPAPYQFIYQQDSQTQSVRESNSLHRQQQRTTADSNYNYSNNNEIPMNHEERYNRSAEKILDAFERFYKNIGRTSATPMKVKYIPEDNNSNHFPQRSTSNYNQYVPTSRNSETPSSARSNSEKITSQGVKIKPMYSYN